MPFTMTPEKAKLRAQFERAVMAEIERVGPAGFRRHLIVARWAHAGAGRSTIWRWLREMLDDPAGAGRHFRRSRQRAATQPPLDIPETNYANVPGEGFNRPAEKPPVLVEALDGHARALPPQPTKFTNIPGAGAFQVIEKLHDCIAAATRVMSNAQCAPHDMRSARLVLQASETLRRCIETAIRLHDEMWNAARVEEFHSAIIAEVAVNDGPTAERIMARLEASAHRWGNPE